MQVKIITKRYRITKTINQYKMSFTYLIIIATLETQTGNTVLCEASLSNDKCPLNGEREGEGWVTATEVSLKTCRYSGTRSSQSQQCYTLCQVMRRGLVER